MSKNRMLHWMAIIAMFFPLIGKGQHAADQGQPVDRQAFFIENRGQWPEEVLYLIQFRGLNAWMTREGIVYDFYRETPVEATAESMDEAPDIPYDNQRIPQYHREGHVVRMALVDARPLPHAEGEQRRSGRYNYFIGNDPDRWVTNVPLYRSVVVNDIYPGVRIRHYLQDGKLRYDFIVAPGADPSQIAFRLEGTDGVWITEEGDLAFQTRFGEVRHGSLKAYQKVGDDLIEVACRMEKNKSGGVSFRMGAYDPSRPLIIDPALDYSTLIGGTNNDRGYVLVVDDQRQSYIVGKSHSANFPTTTGAYDETHNGNADVVVSKLNAFGSGLIFSTFIGGSGYEDGYSIRIAHDNEHIVVAGGTYSSNFPTTSGAYDQTHNGSADGFVLKLDSSGSTLVFSTFLGGSGYDWSYSTYMDFQHEDVYVTGDARSSNFPTTPGAYDVTHNGGGGDVFVLKLDSTGSFLHYSTFIGGSNHEWGHFIQVDSFGRAYINGGSRSTNYPTTVNAYDKTHNGNYDAILSTLDSTGSHLLYSTYLGGSGYDWASKSKLTRSGGIYVTGETRSNNFPTTAGVYDPTYNGGSGDIFAAKLDSTLSNLLASTFIGGSGKELSLSLEFDTLSNIYLSGETNSTNFPTTPGTYDSTHNGGYDGYILKMDSALTTLLYSSYIGGSSDETAHSVSIDSNDYLYLGGKTRSADFPVTNGAYDTTQNGDYDIFIMRWSTPLLPVELVHFDARVDHGKVLLTWSTASEKNSMVFVVERSADGRQFQSIGEVEAAGVSTTLRHYQFVDAHPLEGLAYYRLRQVDYDGSEILSEVRTVMLRAADVFDLKATVVTHTLELTDVPAGVSTVAVVNAEGRKVWEKAVSSAASLLIPTAGLPSGRYLVRVRWEDGHAIERPFFKQ